MSLATEAARTFVQASHSVVNASLNVDQLQTGTYGLGVLVVPADQAAGSTVPIDADTTCVITLSNQNFNIQFSAAECYVGRVIQGINKGQGICTFTEAEPGSITFVDNAGFSYTSSTTTLAAFTGAFAYFVCTEANGTTATLQTLFGTYGGSPVLEVAPSATTATVIPATTSIRSISTATANVTFVPLFLHDDGLPGRKISVTQVGGTTGSLNLVGTGVTFLNLTAGASFSPTVTAGNTLEFVVVSGTPTTVVLQQVK